MQGADISAPQLQIRSASTAELLDGQCDRAFATSFVFVDRYDGDAVFSLGECEALGELIAPFLILLHPIDPNFQTLHPGRRISAGPQCVGL